MKKNLLKSMLTAFALILGTTSAWADVTPFSESYSASSTTDGWKTSVNGRFNPAIIEENGNYFLSVNQSQRNNNGAKVTGTVINGKAAAGDDFTLSFDMRLSSSSNQSATAFEIYDAANKNIIFSLKETKTWTTSWYLNGTTETIELPNSNKANSKNSIADVTWCTYTITRSGENTFLTIVNKENGYAIYNQTPILNSSTTGGLGNMIFTSSRYMANFAIDNIVVREVEDDDLPLIFFNETNGLSPFVTIYSDEAKTNKVGYGDLEDGGTYYFTATLDGYYDYEDGSFTVNGIGNVVTFTMEQMPRYAVTVNAVDADKNVIEAIFTDNDAWDGKPLTYICNAYLTDDNNLVTYAKKSMSKFVYNITANSEKTEYTVEYKPYEGTAYFFECENMTASKTYGNGTGASFSGNNSIGIYMNANFSTKVKLPSAQYKLSVGSVARKAGTMNLKVQLSYDNGNTWEDYTSLTTPSVAEGVNGEYSANDPVLAIEECYIRFVEPNGSNSLHYQDYVLIEQVGPGRPTREEDPNFYDVLENIYLPEIENLAQIFDVINKDTFVGVNPFQFNPGRYSKLQAAFDEAYYKYNRTIISEEDIYDALAELRKAVKTFHSAMPEVNAQLAIKNVETGLYLNLSNGVELAETPTPIQFHNIGLTFEQLLQTDIDIYHTGYLYNTPNREYMGIAANDDLTLTNQKLTKWYIITLTDNKYIIAYIDEEAEEGSVLTVSADKKVLLTPVNATQDARFNAPSYWTIYWFDDVEDIARDPFADDSASDPATSINGVSSAETSVSIYNASGTQLKSIKKGLNIIKMSDGQVKKVFIK